MIAETIVPILAIRSARTGLFDWPSDVAPGNVAPVLSQQSGAGLTGSWRSSDIGFFSAADIDDLTDLGFKSLFLYRLKQLFLINCIYVVGHEQQILQINRIRITVPLVFDRLDTLKP